MKKIFSFFLASVLMIGSLTTIPALTDEMILKDPVRHTFTGQEDAEVLINNLNFNDLPATHWAKEAVIRVGALNLIKGYDDSFGPDRNVTNLEALEYVLRALGLENRAHQAAIDQESALPEDSSLRTLWGVGYVYTAMQLRLISNYDYLDSLADQKTLDPEYSFIYGDPVTRQQFAAWLFDGLRTSRANIFATNAPRQKIFEYSDWDQIDADKVEAVEALAMNGVMTGVLGKFLPEGAITRAEAAIILKNLDKFYLDILSIEKRTGTVGAVRSEQTNATAGASLALDIYIRTSYGYIDVLRNYFEASTAPKMTAADVPIYKDGDIAGLSSLEEGDMVEYLVREATSELIYVQVLDPAPITYRKVRGSLIRADVITGDITIADDTGKEYSFPMVDGIYLFEDGVEYVIIDEKKRELLEIPNHSTLELELINDICVKMAYIGQPVLIDEFRGIVIENDADFGYMTVIDNGGGEVTQFYYENDLKVKKKQYYDTEDEVGYISQVFPYFKYNPAESSIDQIEPGDIVFIRPEPDDPTTIMEISASTNYIAKYGKILQFNSAGDYFEMLLEYENKQSAWFAVPDGIFVSSLGRPIKPARIVPGDWAKVLVNQAIISPGCVIESAKELIIENDGRHISGIYKGRLAGIDSVQGNLLVQNVYKLSKTGWTDYKNADKFSITGGDIEYYLDGKQISLDYALKYLKRADNDVYIALENNYAGERVKKVTFRSGRDELLGADTVIRSGVNEFSILSVTGVITTDPGTIVRRFGRLVDGNSITIPDYAVVSLNGGNTAAVVDITETPDNSQIMLMRGRILSVDEGVSFRVQSMSVLTGVSWFYTPIVREFSIDHDTIFLNSSGPVGRDEFIGYTSASVVDRVYNLVADGGRAAYVVDAPYSLKGVRGTVYAASGNTFSLKDMNYYDNGEWLPISGVDASGSVAVLPNTVIAKNNKIIPASGIEPGDQLRIMTDVLPEIAPGLGVNGYIIFVEK